MALHLPDVPAAPLQGVLTAAALQALDHAAAKVEAGGDLTEAEAALVLMSVGPAAREVLQWRRRAQLARDVLAEDNVLMFPGAR